MKNKKSILVLVALVAVIAILFGVYAATRPKTRAEVAQTTQESTGEAEQTEVRNEEQTDVADGADTPDAGADEQTKEPAESQPTADTVAITVIVVHKDGTERVYELETAALYLGEVLLEEGIVEGELGPYGLMINAADGEVADWNVDQSYWAIYIGEEYATTGADGIPVFGGDVYKLVYTIG